MAVHTASEQWLQSIKKLEEEDTSLVLSPKPWESIPSESGHFSSPNNPPPPLYHTPTLSEGSLVRLAMNALQGVESALISVEKISEMFCSDPADRTFHRIPSLWNRSSSSIAIGRILKSIGRSGCIVYLLLKFVDYFTTTTSFDGISRGNKSSEPEENVNDYSADEGQNTQPSLVNQAFAVSVGKILEGYISALNTLHASVGLRRSSKTSDVSSEVGFLTSVAHSNVSLLEIYVHTEGLRVQIDALGNICNVHEFDICHLVPSSEDFSGKTKFRNFPTGGNLLTYLYTQLKVSDPVHCALLKFLFLRSFEPYSEFIRSWIYKAKISDPYNEFIVDYVDNMLPYAVYSTGISADFFSASIREQDKVAVPCFLKDLMVPLFRAGQQLQILMKLLELSDNVGSWDHIYEDIFPFWKGLHSNFLPNASPLTFNKEGIEAMVLARNEFYRQMMEKLENLSMKLNFRYLQVVPTSKRFCNIPISVAMNEDSFISPLNDTKNQHSDMTALDPEASSMTDEVSYAEDSLDSDCSSIDSSEEQNLADKLVESRDNMAKLEGKYLSALSLSSSICIYNSSHTTFENDKPCDVETKRETCEKKDLTSYFPHHEDDDPNSNRSSLNIELNKLTLPQPLETIELATLPRGPIVTRGLTGNTRSRICCSGLEESNRNIRVLDNNTSFYGDMMLSGIVSEGTDQHQSGSDALSNSFSSPSWKVKYDSKFLSANPIVTKHSSLRCTYMQGERSSTECRYNLSSFDFTSVKDPIKLTAEKLPTSPRHRFGTALSARTGSATATGSGTSHVHDTTDHNGNGVLLNLTKSSHLNLPLGSTIDSRENTLLKNASGGSGWQSLLSNSYDTDEFAVTDHKTSLTGKIEMPLDFVIEKCLLEEILLQYKYVSKLTIKVLEEGFNLQEHLLALRRYHFMELADWADLFIMSLWRHKWYATDAEKRISEIQGFLDLSIQRSSCERDDYKDRIYLYFKEEHKISLSVSTIAGIHSFDYLGLGYRVDWPISIILTPSALKIYAEIFSFLIRVKLALSSLVEAWCSSKELMQITNQHDGSELHESEAYRFSVFMRLRQQVNHFVATLQQYVQSQLSHVSWGRFVYSLKHEVKDMVDLEFAHMSYLTESLHICFLSDETRGIATIIRNILQCALDFRSCVTGSTWETGPEKSDSSSKVSRISISQVLALKGTFDRNIRELHLCYLNSPRHGEFSISRFWDYVNYNDYYTEVVGKEMGHRAFFS